MAVHVICINVAVEVVVNVVGAALRDLLIFLDIEQMVDVVTNFQDQLKSDEVTVRDVTGHYERLQSYKDRVESYIRKHKDHITIRKLQMNKPITREDLTELERLLFDGKELGTKEDYIKEYGEQPLGEFIRGIVGLDKLAVQDAFSDFIQAGNLRADQLTFINTMINELTKNGILDKTRLFKSPYTDQNDNGIFGLFNEAEVTHVLKIIEKVNHNAIAAA